MTKFAPYIYTQKKTWKDEKKPPSWPVVLHLEMWEKKTPKSISAGYCHPNGCIVFTNMDGEERVIARAGEEEVGSGATDIPPPPPPPPPVGFPSGEAAPSAVRVEALFRNAVMVGRRMDMPVFHTGRSGSGTEAGTGTDAGNDDGSGVGSDSTADSALQVNASTDSLPTGLEKSGIGKGTGSLPSGLEKSGKGMAGDSLPTGLEKSGNGSSGRVNLLIGMPVYGQQMYQATNNLLLSLGPYFAHAGIQARISHRYDSLITRARNDIVAEMLSDPSHFTHLLWVDADVSMDANVVMELLAHNEDVVCAPYPRKHIDYEEMARFVRHKQGEVTAEELQAAGTGYVINWRYVNDEGGRLPCLKYRGKFVTVAEAGTGCMLIKRSVFERLMKEPDAVRYVSDTNQDDTQRNMKAPFYFNFFDTMKQPGTGRLLSEDYAFCEKCTRLGIDIWLHTEARLVHTGTHNFMGQRLIQRLAPFLKDVPNDGSLYRIHPPRLDDQMALIAPKVERVEEVAKGIDSDTTTAPATTTPSSLQPPPTTTVLNATDDNPSITVQPTEKVVTAAATSPPNNIRSPPLFLKIERK